MNLSINRKIFNHIIKSPTYYSEGDLTFQYRLCDDNYLGFVVPRRLGAAHKRNQFKRRCRFLFDSMKKTSSTPTIGVIIQTKCINMSYKQLNRAFANLNKGLVE